MRAGKLRRRVWIQTNVPVRGPSGSMAPNWTDSTSPVWAGFDAMTTGGDRVAADQRVALQTRVCRIRHREGVTTANRIRDGAAIFEIVDVADTDKKTELVLTLKALGAGVR